MDVSVCRYVRMYEHILCFLCLLTAFRLVSISAILSILNLPPKRRLTLKRTAQSYIPEDRAFHNQDLTSYSRRTVAPATTKCFTESRWFRREVTFDRQYMLCPWIHNVGKCTTFTLVATASQGNSGTVFRREQLLTSFLYRDTWWLVEFHLNGATCNWKCAAKLSKDQSTCAINVYFMYYGQSVTCGCDALHAFTGSPTLNCEYKYT